MHDFTLSFWDYVAFGGFLAVFSIVGYLAGRKERSGAADYFLAGKKLPWYVVGGSFIAANINRTFGSPSSSWPLLPALGPFTAGSRPWHGPTCSRSPSCCSAG